MPIINTAIAMGLSFVMLTGCSSHAETVQQGSAPPLPETDITEESVSTIGEEGSEQNEKAVTFVVFGGRYANDEDEEYILENEQAEKIYDLFYNHEKEICDSPVASAATLKFKIGEDYLTTDTGALNSLSGRINGELVLIELRDSEYDAFRQLVYQYVTEIP